MNNFKPLAPADETLIQYLKMGSDLVNRKRNSALEMSSKPVSQNLLLDNTLTISTVTLRAKNYVNLAGFYKTVLGLEILENNVNKKRIVLGRNRKPLVIVKDGQILSENNKRSPGLFHFALLYENESALASTLLRVNYFHPELYKGATDDGIATNFYLEDPEGNGIKLYSDRNPNSWKWLGNTVQVNPQPIDQGEYLKWKFSEIIDEKWDQQEVSIGHVHLQVPNMSKAKEFYNGLFGFNTTLDLPSVNFYSADGYHQNFSVNTWNSRGVNPAISCGIEEIQVTVSDDNYLSALKRKLQEMPFKSWVDKEGRLMVTDPSTLIKFEIKLVQRRIIQTSLED